MTVKVALLDLSQGKQSTMKAGFLDDELKEVIDDRYNIVNDADLKLAAQKQESYLKSLMGTVSGTIHDLQEKRANR